MTALLTLSAWLDQRIGGDATFVLVLGAFCVLALGVVLATLAEGREGKR